MRPAASDYHPRWFAAPASMPNIFDKLNLAGRAEILVLNAPASFESALQLLRGVRILRGLGDAESVRFALAFVTRRVELSRVSVALAGKASGDALLWFAYPKGTSARYQCDFNRDTGWDALRELGFDSVRQVAIDEDWSAVRFRRIEFIKIRKR
jgi:hypothetical protein